LFIVFGPSGSQKTLQISEESQKKNGNVKLLSYVLLMLTFLRAYMNCK